MRVIVLEEVTSVQLVFARRRTAAFGTFGSAAVAAFASTALSVTPQPTPKRNRQRRRVPRTVR